MSQQEPQPPQSASPSSRRRAASLRNLEKAWQASREHWEFTPARRRVSMRTIKMAQRANRLHPRPASPAQREAARRNILKAGAALQARGRSPEHLAKLRETIVKARAARSEKSLQRQAEKVLKHGLFARRLRGPLAPLGENPRDYKAIHRLTLRYLAPQNPEEEKLAHLIADALWRNHRMYFAQAVWQFDQLRFFLSKAPPPVKPDLKDYRLRAYALLSVLLDRDKAHERAWRLLGSTERLLRRFLRLRYGRDPNFRTGRRIVRSADDQPEWIQLEVEAFIRDPEIREMIDELYS